MFPPVSFNSLASERPMLTLFNQFCQFIFPLPTASQIVMSENESVTNGEAQVHTPPKILDDPTGLPQSTRQSSRLQTPISQPEFIAPLSDSCRSLATNTNRTRPKPGSKKSSTAVLTMPPDEINKIPSESEDGIQVQRKKSKKRPPQMYVFLLFLP
jgi:hypothetical protein